MPNVLDILNKQQYTPISGYVVRSKVEKYEIRCIDVTDDAQVLANKITKEKSYTIDQALSQQNEFKVTALQFLSEQRLYRKPYAGGSLYDKDDRTLIATSVDQFKQYANNKYSTLAPVVTALIKPFEDKSANQQFTNLLLIQNPAGQTVAHSFFSNFTSMVPFIPVLDRVSLLSVEQKTSIAKHKDKDSKNLFHVLAIRNWQSRPHKMCFDAFGPEATLTAMIAQDSQGKTPLHYTFAGCETEAAVSYAELVSRWGKSSVIVESAIKLQDFTGKNILHYALSHSEGAKAKELVAVALDFVRKHTTKEDKDVEQPELKQLTSSQKALFYSALVAPDHTGISPFQLACQKGYDEVIDLIFKNLDPEQCKALAKQRKKDGFTALHFACQGGYTSTVDKILNALGSEEIYKIYKTDKKILHKLVQANKNLQLELFENKINEKIAWFQAHDYMLKRSDRLTLLHPIGDLKKRERDFAKLLSSDGILPLLREEIGFGTYIQARSKLTSDPEQQASLKRVIEKNKNKHPEEYKLASAVDPSKVLEEMLNYLEQRQKVKPGFLSYKYSDYVKRIDDFIACLKNILQGEELSSSALRGSTYNRLRGGLAFVTSEQVNKFIEKVKDLNKTSGRSTDVLTRLIDAFADSQPKKDLGALSIQASSS